MRASGYGWRKVFGNCGVHTRDVGPNGTEWENSRKDSSATSEIELFLKSPQIY